MKQKKLSDQFRQIASDYDGISQELFQMAALMDQNDHYNLQEKMMCRKQYRSSKGYSFQNGQDGCRDVLR